MERAAEWPLASILCVLSLLDVAESGNQLLTGDGLTVAVVVALSYQPEIKTQGIELMARPENQEYTGDSSHKARPPVQVCF